MAGDVLEHPLAGELLAAAESEGLDLVAALDSDEESLRATDIAQPALFLVEVVLARALSSGVPLVGVAGHSVGEYAAAVGAGVFTPVDGMRLVIARGRAMAAMGEGTMAALLGADLVTARRVCAEATDRGLGPVVVANDNAPGQVVVSGTRAGVEAAVAMARDAGVRKATLLRVGGAFHSPLMTDAASRFGATLAATAMRDPVVPLVCNVDATSVSTADAFRTRLERQLVSPVRWRESVETLIAMGATVLIEVGPGSVLTSLARRINPDVRAVAVNRLDAIDAVVADVGVVTHG